MELPHRTLWIEAHPDMPHSLKVRCVEAFEKIHAAGVLHGDVELHHMLIGADGNVMIVDFRHAKATRPIPEVQISWTSRESLRMEMRRVKYKLNFEDCRQKEEESRAQTEEWFRMEAQRITIQHGRVFQVPNPVPAVDDEVINPPIMNSREWDEWNTPKDTVRPRRFVVPGRTHQELEAAVCNLLHIAEGRRPASPPPPHPPPPPPPYPPPPSPPPDDEPPPQPKAEEPRYSLRKRKEAPATPSTIRPAKRGRSSIIPPNTPTARDTGSASRSKATSKAKTSDYHGSSNQDESNAAGPSRDRDRLLGLLNDDDTKPDIKPNLRDIKPILRNSKPTPRDVRATPQDIKPTPRQLAESLALSEGLAQLNREHCEKAGLQYRKSRSRQTGTIRRELEDFERPGFAEHQALVRKIQYQTARAILDSGAISRKRKRGSSPDILDRYLALGDDYPDIREGPKILARGESEAVTKKADKRATKKAGSPRAKSKSVKQDRATGAIVSDPIGFDKERETESSDVGGVDINESNPTDSDTANRDSQPVSSPSAEISTASGVTGLHTSRSVPRERRSKSNSGDSENNSDADGQSTS